MFRTWRRLIHFGHLEHQRQAADERRYRDRAWNPHDGGNVPAGSSEEVVAGDAREVRAQAAWNRSLPRGMTPPIDNAITDGVVPIAQPLIDAGVTPNMLSVVGGLFGAAALIALWFDRLVLFVLLFAASYWFDTVDGWFARTFHMTSKAGEYLDHGKDLILGTALMIIVLCKYVPHIPVWVSALLGLAYVAALVCEGCTQRAIAGGDSNLISGFGCLCPPGTDVRMSRHASTPSFLLVTGLIVLAAAAARRGRPNNALWR